MNRIIPDYLPDNVRELLQLADKIWCVEVGMESDLYNPGWVGWELWNADEPAETVTITLPGSYDEFAKAIAQLLER